MSDIETNIPIASQIPAEIWSITFRLFLGFQPFRRSQCRAYNSLRRVCSAWKTIVANTPGLCPGLSIGWPHFKYDVDIENFKALYAPWLSIISPKQRFTLVLGKNLNTLPQKLLIPLAQYLLCEATPSPTALHCYSSRLFQVILSMKRSCDSVTRLDLPFGDQIEHFDFPELPVVLPRLESIGTTDRLTVTSPHLLTHPNLRSLTLLDFGGVVDGLARLCMGLPALRELKIASNQTPDDYPPTFTVDKPFVHLGLETLLIVGEDTLLFLTYLTLPSLKFFGLEMWGMNEDDQLLEDTLSSFFQRSQPSNTTVSLKGQCPPRSLAAVTRSLPPATTSFLDIDIMDEDEEPIPDSRFEFNNVKKIICTDPSGLCRYTNPSSCNREITVMVPKGFLEEGSVEELREEMRDRGFFLEPCSPRVVEATLGSSSSPLADQWASRYGTYWHL